MLAYVTLLGRSEWAAINTYYKLLREWKLEDVGRIYIFTEEGFKEKLPKVRRAFDVLSKAYGMSPSIEHIVIPNYSFDKAEKALKELFSKLGGEGYGIGLDITSGRKALVAAAIVQAMRARVSFVVYMGLLDREFPNRPYMMIPTHLQVLKDFLGEEKFDR
jgi:hypothetical protein